MTAKPVLKIVPYRPAHRAGWQSLNAAWLVAGGFTVEPKDRRAIDDPEGAILAIGGHIFIAERDGQAVGCCALLPMADGGREVAKMTVTPQARGLGLARQLLQACEATARAAGAPPPVSGNQQHPGSGAGPVRPVRFHAAAADPQPLCPLRRLDGKTALSPIPAADPDAGTRRGSRPAEPPSTGPD